MLIGYIRPDQDDPDCERQLQILTDINCNKIIAETHSSTKRRIHLEYLLRNLKAGDKVIVTKLYIIADSTRHLVELLDIFAEKDVYLLSLEENIDTGKTDGYSFTGIVKHLAAFQSDVISRQTKKGMIKAKQDGVITGRPRKPDENVKRAIEMYESKEYNLTQIKAETGISKSTLYRYMES